MTFKAVVETVGLNLPPSHHELYTPPEDIEECFDRVAEEYAEYLAGSGGRSEEEIVVFRVTSGSRTLDYQSTFPSGRLPDVRRM